MFLETICIEKKIVQNKNVHVSRMHRTAAHFGFHEPELPDLCPLIPDNLFSEKVKCSIVYKEKIEKITFDKYIPRRVNSLKIIEVPDLNYSFKFSDRGKLNHLLTLKDCCDEILITQNGCITDTGYSNVVFKRNNQFFTPDTYLLNGTKREKLICEGKIKEMRITVNEIAYFEHIYLINAMLDIEDGICIPTKKIML